MDLALLVYTYFTLDSIVNLMGLYISLAIIIAVIAWVIVLLKFYDNGYDNRQEWKKKYSKEDDENRLEMTTYNLVKTSFDEWGISKVVKPKLILWLIVIISFFPSKDTIKYMIGAYGIQWSSEALASNEEFKKLPSNVFKAANDLLENLSENAPKEEK